MDAMTAATITAPALWSPPPAVRVRGVLAVVAGAGEGVAVYARFGRRLSADGYSVAVFEAAEGADAAAWLAASDISPRVLVGSDRGAAVVLALAAVGGVDGVVVAGLPVDASASAADDAARTSCPVHLGVLATPEARAAAPAPEVPVPDAAALRALRVPVLAIHGGADPIAPLEVAHERLAAVPALELVETVDGLHDALNDQSHRSVAARIVLWLERLRGAGVDVPVIREVRA